MAIKSDDAIENGPDAGTGQAEFALAVSERKREANRRNAQLSTGPKTTDGKRRISQNAITHGLLAKSFLSNAEEEGMLKEIWNGCREYYEPIGMPEEMLVKDIAMSFLLDIRGHRYEAGEIRKQTLAAIAQPRQEPVFQDDTTDDLSSLFTFSRRQVSSSQEAEHVLGMLDELRIALEAHKSMPQKILFRLSEYLGKQWRDVVDRQTMLERVRREQERMKRFKDEMVSFEPQRQQAHIDALALPSPEVVPNLLRYSTANLNRRYRAMAQLERLQRQRKGEPVPAPVQVNLNSE